MNNKLGIQDLASAFSDRYGMDAKSSQVFVKTVFDIVEEYVATDKLVKIKGLGTFKLINVSDRESINVNTGERIVIAGHTKMSFTPDNALKDAVNRPFSDFETTVLNDNTSTEEMEKIPTQGEESSYEDSAEECIREQNHVVHEDTVAVEATEVAEDEQTDESLKENEQVQEDASSEEAASVVLPKETESMFVRPSESTLHVHKPNDDNPSYPMAEEPIVDSGAGNGGKSRSWLYVCLCLVLMAGSYICGHYRLLNKVEVVLYSESNDVALDAPILQAKEAETIDECLVTADNAECDSIFQDSLSLADTTPVSVSAAQEDPEEIAKYFPQVPGGEYWIVGDAGYVHHMQVGETLYRIARKELGDQNLVRYLIVFNKFEDPNIIHTGDPIRIPKLVKKVQAPSEED